MTFIVLHGKYFHFLSLISAVFFVACRYLSIELTKWLLVACILMTVGLEGSVWLAY